MNKLFSTLVLCFLLSGCFTKKQKTHTETIELSKPSMVNDYVACQSKDVFDDDLEAFVLEEEFNPISADGKFKNNIDLEENNSSINQGQSASKYGMKTLYFDFDKYNIRPDQAQALQNDLQIVKNLTSKGDIIVIEGHACNSAGSAAYNIILSEKEQKKLKSFL